MDTKSRLLLFGATGSIGKSIKAYFQEYGWDVFCCSRNPPEAVDPSWIRLDPLSGDYDASALKIGAPYAAVCWAQGKNVNDDIHSVDLDTNAELYRANCQYILITLRDLLANRLLDKNARLCVISSIWQNLARQKKLSYCMTKAALQGLVLSASVDLAEEGYLINAILPGAVESRMTRKNLSESQIETLEKATGFGRLATAVDVASLCLFLCSEKNKSITGQFIAVDLGFSHARII